MTLTRRDFARNGGNLRYDTRGPKDTPNDLDGVAGGALPPLAAMIGDATAGYVAMIVVKVA